MPTEPKPWPVQRFLWPCLLALAGVCTLWLAWNRVYQVDEAQTVYMAAVLAKGWKGSLFTSGQLHLFPLALLVRPSWSSSQIFLAFRLAFWVLAWINAVLVVLAAGIRLRSREGIRALVLAGSLAPWWAYALECRHDNVLILGTLLFWILARRLPALPRWAVFFLLGGLALALQACLFKSIATWAPLTLLVLLAERASWPRKAALACFWGAGAVAMALVSHAIRAHAGLLANVHEGAAALGGAAAMDRFSPLHALGRLLEHAPWLAALMAVLLAHAALILHRRGLAGALEEEGAPETGLFLVGALAFLANPTPFPYNLAALSGLALVAALALGKRWLSDEAWQGRPAGLYILAAGLTLHALPLAGRFMELAGLDNERQEFVMETAESLTGPRDPVFDAIGLVPTRPGPSFSWFINMTNLQTFARTSITRTWAGNVPPVLLASYRLGYLQDPDRDFIRDNYVAIRKDINVLGTVLLQGAPARTWTCQRSGRYCVVPLSGDSPGPAVDGATLAPGFHEILAGPHGLGAQAGGPCLLVWAGPNLKEYPSCQPADGPDSVCPVPMQL